MFLFEHPAGNKASIWVFRAVGVTSQHAIERWGHAENSCGPSPQWGIFAERSTLLIHRTFRAQCQPVYGVALDSKTVVMIVDDGGNKGDASQAPPVPYRPAVEIAQLIVWLQQNLPGIPLMTGVPIPQQG